MKTSLLSILILIISLSSVLAQQEENDLSFVVSGKVINPENMEGISYAHINLHGTYWGIICDSLGFFHLRVNPDQQLKISALGFKEQIVDVIPPTVDEEEVFQEIYMEKQSFMLETVNVYSLGTWADFKENFVKKDLPKEENIASSFDFGNLKLSQAEANTLSRDGGGFGFGFGFNGKKAKRSARMNPLNQLHEEILTSKFNRKLVADVTKESGERLDYLVKYINSKSNFSHQTSEYYIVNKVKQLYTEFLQENPQFEENLTFTDSLGKISNHLRP